MAACIGTWSVEFGEFFLEDTCLTRFDDMGWNTRLGPDIESDMSDNSKFAEED